MHKALDNILFGLTFGLGLIVAVAVAKFIAAMFSGGSHLLP